MPDNSGRQHGWEERRDEAYVRRGSSRSSRVFERGECTSSSDERATRSRRWSGGSVPETGSEWAQAMGAAGLAVATESFRNRHEPLDVILRRAATAGVAALGLAGFMKGEDERMPKRKVAAAALGGLLGSRAVNGRRCDERRRRRCHRERSRRMREPGV